MNQNILIVGAGGIGSILGLHLQAAHYRVQYLRRFKPAALNAPFPLPPQLSPQAHPKDGEQINTLVQDCTVTVNGQPQRFQQKMVLPAALLQDPLQKITAVFWATKAYDYVGQVEAVLTELSGVLSSDCLFVPLCNGNVEAYTDSLALHFGTAIRVCHGFCNFGVTRLADGTFRTVIGGGRVFLGDASLRKVKQSRGEKRGTNRGENTGEAVEPSLLARVPLLVWEPEVKVLLRKKWFFNVVINSLCAAYGLHRNGLILERFSDFEIEQVVGETYELAKLLFDDFPFTRTELSGSLRQLIHATSENKNSMVQDLELIEESGSGRTENSFLAGQASRWPERFPMLVNLDQRIKAAEKTHRTQ